ncbi:phosphatidylserine synthase [Rubellimicrobium rubrum]|uniref:Phosphatidylserine synthase n=1 Tax=Rubellimicrobium rubrum TaxID=2585369 RepID=A0A5C4MLL5_9RHOB|nr:phospholipase D-like domain-containing protein [Rubellimicrobium rubrum]TNC45040.1 phosphatidylserine synthase [Rubellimicrobium rubrum]
MQIAIPVYRLSCKVGIDRGRAWSVIEELVLWALAQKARTIAELSTQSGLHRQLIVASVARMMRFRLVELSVRSNGAVFQASSYGKEVVASGRTLPFFPKREAKRVSFVIERVAGNFFPGGQVRLVSEAALAQEVDDDLRVVVVEGGGPTMSHEANFARLSKIAARGWEEQLAIVDGRTASLRSEFMLIRVVDGVPRNLPDTASETLRRVIATAAAVPRGTSTVPVEYQGPSPEPETVPSVHACSFGPDDVVIGGSAQLALFQRILRLAHRRVIIHSTFLDHKRFRELLDEIRAACIRGVSFDLLWGAETLDADEDNRNGVAAVEIARIIREDRDLARRFRIHLRSTGSHSKLLLADSLEGDWTAAVGSCNWLSSPFRAVELTAVLSDPHVVADVAEALQRMVGRRGLSDDIATEMSLVARELRRLTPRGGSAQVSLLLGDRHDALMRSASGQTRQRFIVGSHRLGSTARPGVMMPGEAAVSRSDATVSLLYTVPSGPLKKRHARKLAEEAAENGVRLLRVDPPLHGKFLAWDDDDLAITSLNWASAASDLDFPQADIGVHVHAPDIAADAVKRLGLIYPELVDDHSVPTERTPQMDVEDKGPMVETPLPVSSGVGSLTGEAPD